MRSDRRERTRILPGAMKNGNDLGQITRVDDDGDGLTSASAFVEITPEFSTDADIDTESFVAGVLREALDQREDS